MFYSNFILEVVLGVCISAALVLLNMSLELLPSLLENASHTKRCVFWNGIHLVILARFPSIQMCRMQVVRLYCVEQYNTARMIINPAEVNTSETKQKRRGGVFTQP